LASLAMGETAELALIARFAEQVVAVAATLVAVAAHLPVPISAPQVVGAEEATLRRLELLFLWHH